MICRLCLKNVECIINIFNDLGIELNAAEIVAKHFWFEPKPDDPISTSICEACWHQVSDFNQFYLSVEEAHKLLTERFSLSFNANKAKKSQTTNENAVSTTTTKPSIIEQNKVTCNKTAKTLNSSLNIQTTNAPIEIVTNETTKNLDIVPNSPNINNVNNTIDEANFEDATYITLSDVNEWDEDVLEETSKETQTSKVDEPTKRITRNTLKEKQNSSSAISLKSNISPKSAKELTKRGRGRPKKNLTKETTNLPANDISDEKKISSEIVLKQPKTDYKAQRRESDERIAKFLQLVCDVCNEKQENFTNLCKHMVSTHKQRGFVICCRKKFYKRVALKNHVEKHLNPDIFSCKECDKTFADKQCLRNHMTIKHIPEESKIFSCEYCHKKFAKSYLLEQHQTSHKERNHICEICQKGFPSTNQLKAHIKVIHNNYGTMCDICAKVIRGHAAFSRHILEHQGVELPKVQCPMCQSWHKDKYSLQKHIRRHNIEGTQHVCNQCGKVAPNRSALMSHQRFVHKAERAYECGVCKKAFKKQISLKEHMATHTGETLYKCPYCTRTFNSNANMHSHRKKMHPKEFAEARLQRQTQVSLNKTDESIENLQQQEQQQSKSLQLDIDNSDIISLDDENEAHIIMSTNKYELVFKVDNNGMNQTL